MLSKDTEEILRILINLHKKTQSFELEGGYDLFSKGYQNGLSNIFEKLEQNGLIYNYTMFLDGGFILNLSPDALTYFENKEKAEKRNKYLRILLFII
ncbi:hypothetical protein [Treponema socranskii]|uniref:hypothetical protein n=1 Tax=Treponema socranskii TaxID=53419 RepID=UPI003D942E23